MMNKQLTLTKLPEEVQAEIKQKYLEGFSALQLAAEHNLVRQSLSWYIRKHNWDEERRLMRADIFQRFSDNKKAAFTSIYLDGTALLKRAVSDAASEYDQGNLSIKDKLILAKQVSEVIKELDKIQRLDDGMPTEIREERPFSVEALKGKLKKDPFYEETIDEVEFKEVSTDTSDNQ